MGIIIGCFAALVLLVMVAFTAGQVQKSRQVQKEMKSLDKQIQKMQKDSGELEQQLEEARKEIEEKDSLLDEQKDELKKYQEKAEDIAKKADGQKADKQKPDEKTDTQKADTGKDDGLKAKDTEGKKPEGNGILIAIDPGHQSYEVTGDGTEPLGPGSEEMKAKYATGTEGKFTGVPEYKLTMEISRQLKEELESRGYQVVMTRESDDVVISNVERAKLAKEAGADILVRIHANGVDDSSADGALTMVPSPQNPFVANLSEDSYRLGRSIINAYCSATGLRNRGVQYYDDMTGINWSEVPVTIVEMGFMTNKSDDEKMQEPDFQKKMVQGIADGVDDYFK